MQPGFQLLPGAPQTMCCFYKGLLGAVCFCPAGPPSSAFTRSSRALAVYFPTAAQVLATLCLADSHPGGRTMRCGPNIEQKSHVFLGQVLMRGWLQIANDIMVYLWIQLDHFMESVGKLISSVYRSRYWTPTRTVTAEISP